MVSIGTEPNEHTCARPSTPKNRLYFLGIFISELFLGRRILFDGLVADSAQFLAQLYFHRPDSMKVYRPLIENSDITYELEYRRPGKAVSDAVNFCFSEAYEPEWTTFDQSKSAVRTAKLIENVLRPLADVYVEYKKN